LSLIQQRFDRALLIGCPDANWPHRLREFVGQVDVRDPGPLFAAAAGGDVLVEDRWEPPHAIYDLVIAVGTLDTVNDLPRALLTIRWSMRQQGLFLGSLSGGDTLPRLRSAMRAADAVTDAASAHVHPRIEASALAPLLGQAGFVKPVVDVDRAAVSYRSLGALVRDLRKMGSSNILAERSRRSISTSAYVAAARNFAELAEAGRTTETFEILHFACWSPAA
jgi:hypothetical protein